MNLFCSGGIIVFSIFCFSGFALRNGASFRLVRRHAYLDVEFRPFLVENLCGGKGQGVRMSFRDLPSLPALLSVYFGLKP